MIHCLNILLPRHQMLTRVAMTLAYKKVVLGDCASRLSVRLLSNITQGRGAHLPLEMVGNTEEGKERDIGKGNKRLHQRDYSKKNFKHSIH